MMSWKRRLCVYACVAAMAASCVFIIVYAVARGFVNSEREVRSAWEVDVGELLGEVDGRGCTGPWAFCQGGTANKNSEIIVL